MKRQVEIFYAGNDTNATVLVVVSDSTSNNHVVVEMKSGHYYKTGNILAETYLLPEKDLKEYIIKDSFQSLGKEDLDEVKDDYPGILDSITTEQLQEIVLSLPEVKAALQDFAAVAKTIFDEHKKCLLKIK